MLSTKLMQVLFEVTLLAEAGYSVALYFVINDKSLAQFDPDKDDVEFANMWVQSLLVYSKELGNEAEYEVLEGSDRHYGVIKYKGMGGTVWVCKDIPQGYYDVKVPVTLYLE